MVVGENRRVRRSWRCDGAGGEVEGLDWTMRSGVGAGAGAGHASSQHRVGGDGAAVAVQR